MSDVPTGNQLDDENEMLRQNILERHADIFKRKTELLEAAKRVPAKITSQDQSERLAAMIKKFTVCVAESNAAHHGEKAPWLAKGTVVDNAFFRDVRDPLNAEKKNLLNKQTIYMREVEAAARREREREAEEARKAAQKAAERADRLVEKARGERTLELAMAAEAEAKQRQADAVDAARAASVKAAELTRVRSPEGATQSLATFWDYRPFSREDLSDGDLRALLPYIAQEDLEQAVRGFIKAGGRQLDQVVIYQNTRAR